VKFLEKIVHTIVPHEKNRNVPHLLQKKFVALLSVFIVVLFYFNQNNFEIIRELNLTGAVYPGVLADLTNEDRAEEGVPGLLWSDTLENAAKLKAEDMIQNGYFAHTSPSGITPWHWLTRANYSFVYAGENLAIDFRESSRVEKAWLDSPTHRANVLNPRFTEMGIMALDGIFEGRNTTFVVEFFGKPTVSIKPAETSASTVTSETTTPRVEPAVKPEPEVAGVSAENAKVGKPQTKTSKEIPVKIIEEKDEPTDKFIVAQNTDAVGGLVSGVSNLSQNKSLSTWYARLIVSPTNAIKTVYSVILGLIFMAMMLMVSKEYQRHHTKHLVMGMMLMALIGVSLYFLNSPVFV
ncbi:MAG: CAP domain-containing protein, partial [Patescibacteria group bacterium]